MTTQIVEIDAIDAIIEPYDWIFARERVADIEAYWAGITATNPRMFNGTVLIQHRGTVEGRIFRAGYCATDYKSFLAWQRLGFPPPMVRNGFSMAALRAADGAFLLGEMGPHTANAGKIYFAAGTPDLSDVVDGRVDLAASVLRELREETGITVADVQVEDRWTAVIQPERVAFMRHATIDLPADDARQLMLERMKTLEEDELSDIVIVRNVADINPDRMPIFMQHFLLHAFKEA